MARKDHKARTENRAQPDRTSFGRQRAKRSIDPRAANLYPQASEQSSILVPGRKPLIELVRHRAESIQQLYLVEGITPSREFQEALSRLNARGTEILTRSREALDALSQGASHQGVITAVTPRAALSEKSFLRLTSAQGPRTIILIIDEVTDPHNMGALFRVADAFGVAGVIITKDHTSPITSVVRKVSAGSTEFVPYCMATNLRRFLESAKEAGFWLIGTALDAQAGKGEAQSASTLRLDELRVNGFAESRPCGVVVGSEGNGLRRLTKDACDVLVQIPMFGAVESLNVSHAAAVALYELRRGIA